ncbi:MAG: hypothetical protein EA393_00855 [Bacteroidetes bacterium]|nr:MAG: hypothetical protein EA393_00855 [Bacteroidota bacterium]
MFGFLKLNSCCFGASFAGNVTANFFNASFHLHCYRESSKAGPAEPGGLNGFGFSAYLVLNLSDSFDSDCSVGAK